MARILIAAAPENAEMIELMLEGHSVVRASSLNEAVRLIEAQSFDMVLIDVYFDDSRMFDTLRELRNSKHNKSTPAICYRAVGDQSGIIDATLDGIRTSAKLLGAADFVDYNYRSGDHSFNASEARTQIEDELKRSKPSKRSVEKERRAQ